MLIRADFAAPALVRPDPEAWIASPAAGVHRLMLDRVGHEVARATSLVRYDPGAGFTPHVHGGGEEILVLKGVFGDEHGDYPAGTYLRNPPGTSHTPRAPQGSLLFVKLRQFQAGDTTQIALNPNDIPPQPLAKARDVTERLLHEFGDERVTLLDLAPGAELPACRRSGGEEILVVSGSLIDAAHGLLPAGSWLRRPPGRVSARRSDGGCRLYVKTGHLPPDLQAFAA
ncbi:cupin domain-containing protein [Tistrella bauzanensis]|uniref:Cupin domain-containing protein n=1 Tax=Tistrella arctica TaxID=3133430 RepID=A0ABU9YQT7_9PROT